jgi:hypothetical protein
MTAHRSWMNITVRNNLCVEFFSAHFPVSSRCNCSDISSHILIGVAITGKLKSVCSLAVLYSFITYLGAVFQDLSLKITYVRYISSRIEVSKCLTSRCSPVTEIRWGVQWVKGLQLWCILWSVLEYKTKWHTWRNQSNRKYKFHLFQLNIDYEGMYCRTL